MCFHKDVPFMKNIANVFVKEQSSYHKVPITGANKPEISQSILRSWQTIVNILSEITGAKAGLITKITKDELYVKVRSTVQEHPYKIGILGELGFGTQLLPVSGKDIQDEKIFGTCHVATGRSDHLGGNLTPELFNSKMNASHDDILYAPHKTPEINVSSVVMHKNGEAQEIFSDYFPSPWLLDNVSSVYPAEKFLVST